MTRISQQAFMYQGHNRLPAAVIADSVLPSAKPPLIYPGTKRGNGNIKLYGNFNGQVDATLDVKILDTALEVPVVSAPTFRGAGTGKISDISASGLQAQGVQVICLATGTDTTPASAVIEGKEFQAKTEGTPGNAIYIIIDDSMLVFTQTDYSTIKALSIGDTALEGQEWDFDTKVLQGENVPADAHRVAFGLDVLHIYRQYKKYEEGVWKYYFIMPIQYDVVPGSRVYFVTGGRKITVTNGTITEIYTGIVTIADFWQQVKDGSALIEPVESSIDTSLNISSPAVREFATKTDAYFLPPYRGEQSSVYAGELSSIAVTNDAKTELLQLECADNSYVGAEVWNVKGSSSGDMGQARTGQIANFGHVSFIVPQKFPKDWGTVKEDWSWEVDYQIRNEFEVAPPICFNLRQGISSIPQTLTLEYKQKAADCACPPVSFSDKCLGLSEEGGEIGMAYTVPDLLFWSDVVQEAMSEQFSKWQEGQEGRSVTVSYDATTTPYPTHMRFLAVSGEYFTKLKTLAQRIMNLPEDAPSSLQGMVDSYKALVNSISLYLVTASLINSVWHPMGSPALRYWNGSAWDINNYGHMWILDFEYNTALYQSLTDSVLNYERTYGVKKNSVVAIGTCYIDAGGEYYWEVRGAKAYLPAFTDTPYYSTVKSGDQYVGTKEFAFNISVPCTGTLKIGDRITVTIGGALFERTYQLGDLTYLPTIARQNLYLHGGIDGDDLYTFGVQGEIDSLPNYLLDRNAPARYYHKKLAFQIEDGIVPFQVGDVFEFAIEGGHFVWRKDAGAWSSALQITQDLQTLDSGLRIGFEFGVTPSFMQGDQWEILCTQENRTANLLTPWPARRKGTGNITITFDAPVDVDTLIIDMHSLTGNITFKASNVSNFASTVYSAVIAPDALICKLLADDPDVPVTARYFRIEITGEAEIGHVWLGQRMHLDSDADSITPLKRYNMKRHESQTPFSLLQYARKGYAVSYDKSWIENADFVKIQTMFDYLKTAHDMPLYFIPNVNYPTDCMRGTIEIDTLEPRAGMDYNVPPANRDYTLALSIVGVQ